MVQYRMQVTINNVCISTNCSWVRVVSFDCDRDVGEIFSTQTRHGQYRNLILIDTSNCSYILESSHHSIQ